MSDILSKVRAELKQNSDPEVRESSFKFFKEKIKPYGVKSAVVKQIGKENFRAVKSKTKAEIFSLCEQLWQSGYMEESFIACNWSYSMRRQFQPEDFIIFEHWVNDYINNWASCDTFCNHTTGDFVERFPAYLQELKRWAKSENRWMRRASAVSLIVPAKSGKFLKDIFEIADILLNDKDDMVQKGYGWMLKVASNNHEKEVFDFVMKYKSVMPRTALRYAIEKMPAELKKAAMKK